MLKFFSFGKTQGSILITLLVLISLGATYFFIYLPNNEKAVQERRFRCLRKIDTNIHIKIENSFSQIENLLDNYINNSPPYPKGERLADIEKKDSLFMGLTEYITGYPKNNFTLLLPEQANTYFNDNTNPPIYIGEDTSEKIRFYIDIDSHFTLLANKIKFNNRHDVTGNKHHTAISKRDTTISDTTIGIRFEIERFIKPLLPPGIFDDYIVFIKNKKLYETFPSGLNYNNKDADSLLGVQNKIITPGVHNLKIGGTDYRVFSHPAYTYTDSKWILTGLVSDKNYQKEKNQLPLWALLLLLTAVITMLVSLPWIKLYHMGNKDRLTTNDGIASVLVSMALMSLLFFVLFKYHFSFTEDRLSYPDDKSKGHISYPRDDYSRNVLATKVTNAFNGEINSASTLLDSFDKIHKKLDTDVYLLGKGKNDTELKYDTLFDRNGNPVETIKNHRSVPILKNASKKGAVPNILFTKYDILFKKISGGIDVKQIYWLDSLGNERTNLSVDSNNDPKSKYSERNYFKNSITKKYNKTGDHQFYIDQIVSRTEGIFRSVIAKKTNKDTMVIAMTLTAKSLDSVIMPDGYQFAIIDNFGRVLYHSMPSRNLNENIKDEFTDSSKLVSCMEARSDTYFKAEYYGKQYNIKIKPIPNLPYFTIIFEDIEYNDTRDTEAYTFTLSMLVCMLIFLSLKYSVVFFISSKHSFFKKQHFDTSWIGPHAKSHHEYNLAIITNLFIILMLVVFFTMSSFLEYLYILLVSVIFTSIFLNILFANKYENADSYKFSFKVRAAGLLSVLILLIDITAPFNLTPGHTLLLFLYELILTGVYFIIFFKGYFLLTKARGYKPTFFAWTFTHSYALMATTRLVISSGIPVAFFFIYSFNYEQNLDTRYRQLNFASALSQKIDLKGHDTVADNKELNDLKNNLIYRSGIYFDGLSINSIHVINKKKADSLKLVSAYTHEDMLTVELLDAFRLNINDIEVKNNNLNLQSVDSTAFFSKLNKQSGDGSPTQTIYKINSNKYINVSSLSHINYRTPYLLFWALLFLSIFMFYYIIHHIIRKLFALNLHHTEGWGQMDSELLKNNKFNKFVLIVGSPGSNTLLKLKYKINSKKIKGDDGKLLVIEDKDPLKNNVFIADMMKISAEKGEYDKTWKDHKQDALKGHSLVIINHFEYNIQDIRANKIKLDLLESLVEKNISKVIIISTVHPVTFLDSFNEQQNPAPESELGRWYTLLSNFHVVIDPLISSDVQKNTGMPKRAILEETKYTRFLHRMQHIAVKSLAKKMKSRLPEEETEEQVTDSLIFKLQLTSQYFYTDIWQSLTREEKFILYDLAEDGLVNSYDDFNLSMLLCKGLIIRDDGVLMLFNKSFRNFILTAIGEKEINRIKAEVKDNGNWSNLKAPLNLAILAILVFLVTSQQESYTRIITYVTTLGAGIPAVLRIFSLVGSGNNTQKAD